LQTQAYAVSSCPESWVLCFLSPNHSGNVRRSISDIPSTPAVKLRISLRPGLSEWSPLRRVYRGYISSLPVEIPVCIFFYQAVGWGWPLSLTECFANSRDRFLLLTNGWVWAFLSCAACGSSWKPEGWCCSGAQEMPSNEFPLGATQIPRFAAMPMKS